MAQPTQLAITDNFTRANQSPITAPWTSNPNGYGDARILSNQFAPVDLQGEAVYATALPASDNPDQVEVGITLAALGELYFGITNIKTNLQGYLAGYDAGVWKIYRFDSNASNAAIATVTNAAAVGDRMYLVYIPDTGVVELWRLRTGTWTKLLNFTSLTYNASPNWYGYLCPSETAVRMTNFTQGQLPPLPVTPTGFTATPGNGQITVSWDPQPGCRFEVDKDGGGTTAYDGTGNSFVDTGLTNGVTYDYVIFAYNDRNVSGSAGPITAIPAAPPAATSPPSVPPARRAVRGLYLN